MILGTTNLGLNNQFTCYYAVITNPVASAKALEKCKASFGEPAENLSDSSLDTARWFAYNRTVFGFKSESDRMLFVIQNGDC